MSLDFFISKALAETPAGGQASPENALVSFLPLIIIFVVFYFLLLRPQSKRAKEHRNMVGNLAKGDEVVTNGGLLGRVSELEENFVTVEVADGVRLKIQRQAISALMPKGTIKSS